MSKPPAKRLYRQTSILSSYRPVRQASGDCSPVDTGCHSGKPELSSAHANRMDEGVAASAASAASVGDVRAAPEAPRSVNRDCAGRSDHTEDQVAHGGEDKCAQPSPEDDSESTLPIPIDFDSDDAPSSCSPSLAAKPATVRPCENSSKLRTSPPFEIDLGDIRDVKNVTALFNVNDIKSGEKRPPRPWPTDYRDYWDNNHVRLPCSPKNMMLVGKGDNRSETSRWKVIEDALSRPLQNSWDIEEAILSYNARYAQRWNFDGLHQFFDPAGDKGGADRAERALYLQTTIPAIARLVLNLPHLIPGGIPLLKKSQQRTLFLSQLQVASLLACAFFCTFPHRNSTGSNSEYASFPSINFSSLFQGDRGRRSMSPSRAAKLRCILHYFQCVTSNPPAGVISFERRFLAGAPQWTSSMFTLSDLFVADDGTIEDDGDGMLQADFANKFIGGGVLGRGCVQEEIRFMVCPELIVSRLFMEMMLEKESIVIVGAERFSFYSGYASSFLWTGPYSDTTPFDKWRRRNTTVLALDALVFHNKAAQFKKPALTRELVKAYCAFKRSTGVPRDYQVAVATGNWGCGAFGGEPYLKALLQLIATSAASRQLLYFTFGNSKLSTDLLELHRALRANNTTVAALWQGILTYSEIYPAPAGGRHLYSFLHRRLCCDESGESEGTEPLSSEGTDVAYSEATELPCSEECVVPCSDEAELPLSEDTAEAAAACLDDSAPLFSDPGEDMGSPAPSSPHLLAGVTRSEDVSRRTQTSGDEPGTVTTSGE
eukprot:scpid34572/ scgid21537/ Poly(ADP-ribose) glycohydrolase